MLKVYQFLLDPAQMTCVKNGILGNYLEVLTDGSLSFQQTNNGTHGIAFSINCLVHLQPVCLA